MDARQFFNLVSEMRNKQKEYFKTRTQGEAWRNINEHKRQA